MTTVIEADISGRIRGGYLVGGGEKQVEQPVQIAMILSIGGGDTSYLSKRDKVRLGVRLLTLTAFIELG